MNKKDVDTDTLIQALPYIQRYTGTTIVIKFGGEIARDQTAMDNLARDIALCSLVGIRIILIHGGGPQVNELSSRLGVETKIIGGSRVTDDETLEIAKMVFGGQISLGVLSALRRRGLDPVGLSGVDAGITHTVKRPEKEVVDAQTGAKSLVDLGHVGTITKVETKLLQLLIGNGFIPVISSLGGDDQGNIFNINADIFACEIAIAMAADKLVVLTDVPGLLKDPTDPTTLISHITAHECEELMATSAITKGMIPKINSLIKAARGGVKRAHILDGKKAHSLLTELFTKDGAGTMITTREEERRYLEE